MGLLGITLDAGFASNGSVYVYRTTGCDPGRVNQVLRGTWNGDQLSFSPDPIVTDIPANTIHNGGGVRSGPDGMLYVGTGDAGTAANSQSPSLAGKVLRVDPRAASPTAEIFARGFRNAFRMGFDPLTGRLWVGDVGENSFEEIDLVSAGANYGWPDCEGPAPETCPGEFARPIFAYPHTGADTLGSSVTGGSFAPANFGPYGGQYFFGDYISGNIYRVPLNGARDGFAARPVLFVSRAGGPVDIQFGADGALYYVGIFEGAVRRVGPTTGVGSLTDRTPPRHRLRIRKRQRLSRLSLADTVNEPATLTLTGTVIASGAAKSKSFRLRTVRRSAQTNRRVRIRMRLRRSAAVSARRLVRRGKRTRVRIKLTGRDAAGNVSTLRRTVRITRP
jgi:hypothetical protein